MKNLQPHAVNPKRKPRKPPPKPKRKPQRAVYAACFTEKFIGAIPDYAWTPWHLTKDEEKDKLHCADADEILTNLIGHKFFRDGGGLAPGEDKIDVHVYLHDPLHDDSKGLTPETYKPLSCRYTHLTFHAK